MERAKNHSPLVLQGTRDVTLSQCLRALPVGRLLFGNTDANLKAEVDAAFASSTPANKASHCQVVHVQRISADRLQLSDGGATPVVPVAWPRPSFAGKRGHRALNASAADWVPLTSPSSTSVEYAPAPIPDAVKDEGRGEESATLNLLRSVRRAVAGDAHAAKALIAALHPSDLALLRLLKLKLESRLTAMLPAGLPSQLTSSAAVAQQPHGGATLRTYVRDRKGRGENLPSVVATKSAIPSFPSEVSAALDAALKMRVATEKAASKLRLKAGNSGLIVGGVASDTASGTASFAAASASHATASSSDLLAPLPVGRARRLRLIRELVTTCIKRALGGARSASARTTALQPAAGVGAMASKPAEELQRASLMRVKSSRSPKLTRIKKILLRERVDRWLAAHPAAAEMYTAISEERNAEADRANAALAAARSLLRQAAITVIQQREDARRMRQVARGRVTVAAKTMSSAATGATRAPKIAPAGISSMADIKRVSNVSKRQVRAVMKELLASKDAILAPASALIQEATLAQHKHASALPPTGAGDVDVAVASTLAALRITSSTRAADVKKLVPRVERPCANAVSTLAYNASSATPAATAASIRDADADQGAAVDACSIADATRRLRRRKPRHAGVDAVIMGSTVHDSERAGQMDADAPRPTDPVVATAPAPQSRLLPARRGYVDQYTSFELDELVTEMIATAYFYQERARESDPRKGNAKRRLVVGLREVARGVRSGKIRAVVVAPNIDPSPSDGGLDEVVTAIVTDARNATPPVPVLFALSRRRLGNALGKSLRMAAVGFITFEGLQGLPTRAIELAARARAEWHRDNDV